MLLVLYKLLDKTTSKEPYDPESWIKVKYNVLE